MVSKRVLAAHEFDASDTSECTLDGYQLRMRISNSVHKLHTC